MSGFLNTFGPFLQNGHIHKINLLFLIIKLVINHVIEV